VPGWRRIEPAPFVGDEEGERDASELTHDSSRCDAADEAKKHGLWDGARATKKTRYQLGTRCYLYFYWQLRRQGGPNAAVMRPRRRKKMKLGLLSLCHGRTTPFLWLWWRQHDGPRQKSRIYLSSRRRMGYTDRATLLRCRSTRRAGEAAHTRLSRQRSTPEHRRERYARCRPRNLIRTSQRGLRHSTKPRSAPKGTECRL
jgi:hypothetical protein